MDKEFLYINSREELLRIEVSSIVFFEGQGNYTDIVLTNKLKNTTCMNLVQTEKALVTHLQEGSRVFARIGKRYIINLNYVYHINLAKQVLVLSDYKTFAYQLPIGKEALRKLKEIYLNVKL